MREEGFVAPAVCLSKVARVQVCADESTNARDKFLGGFDEAGIVCFRIDHGLQGLDSTLKVAPREEQVALSLGGQGVPGVILKDGLICP